VVFFQTVAALSFNGSLFPPVDVWSNDMYH